MTRSFLTNSQIRLSAFTNAALHGDRIAKDVLTRLHEGCLYMLRA